MSSYNEIAWRLARALSPQNPHGPRHPVPVTGIATLTAVDPYTASATVKVNGDSLPIPLMRYMHAYGPDNPPVAGDESVLHVSSAGHIFLMGRHVAVPGLPLSLLP